MSHKTPVLPITALAAVVLGAGLLATGAAEAQKTHIIRSGKVDKVAIAVWDQKSLVEIGRIEPGDTLVMGAGDSVILRVYAPRGFGPGDSRQYLAAKLAIDKGAGAALEDVDASSGSAILRALPKRGVAEVVYQLGDGIEVERPELARASFKVDVQALSRGQKVVRMFYLGILMREMEKDHVDVHDRIARIDRTGYPEVVEVAREIATSDESRTKIYDRGHTHQARLAAIYEHLLDLDPKDFDKYQMEDHIEMMKRGDVVGVVMDIVRSPEFRRVHRYNR